MFQLKINFVQVKNNRNYIMKLNTINHFYVASQLIRHKTLLQLPMEQITTQRVRIKTDFLLPMIYNLTLEL